MHRKLLQTVRALSISLGLLTIGLIVSNPDTITTAITTPDTGSSLIADPVSLDTGSDKAKAHNRRHRAQSQDAMVLPFFSFAQGLRRNSRS